jgi:hypothetical protein
MYRAQPTAKFRDSFVGKSETWFTCKDIFLYRNWFQNINKLKLYSKIKDFVKIYENGCEVYIMI